jgi:DNA-binding transcriptional regulator YdaS (Cro superfamily)
VTTIYLKTLIDKAARMVGNRCQLAKELGVSPAQVYNWQTGKKPCSPADRARLADFAKEDAVQELVRATMEATEGTKRGDQLRAVLGKWLAQTGAVTGSKAGALMALILGMASSAANTDLLRCIKRRRPAHD